MKSIIRIWPAVWLSVAILLGYGSFVGGDTAILAGWLFLFWTVPFGALWWFHGYDVARNFVSTDVAQVGGTVIAIIAAFLFWFVAVPWVRTKFGQDRAVIAKGDKK